MQLYAKTVPRHWATGKLLGEVGMEQWITLEGDLVRVKCRMSYTGSVSHKPHHQELPAVFVQPEFDALMFCEREASPLSQRQPGGKNEYITLAEPWVAWVDKEGLAVGVLAHGCKQATFYRTLGPSACSYVAPIQTFALTPGLVFEHEAWLGVGSVEALRKQFIALPRP